MENPEDTIQPFKLGEFPRNLCRTPEGIIQVLQYVWEVIGLNGLRIDDLEKRHGELAALHNKLAATCKEENSVAARNVGTQMKMADAVGAAIENHKEAILDLRRKISDDGGPPPLGAPRFSLN